MSNILLREILNNIAAKDALKKAYRYFVKELQLPASKIKLTFGSLEGDVQGKVKVDGSAKPFSVDSYTIIMRTNNPHSEADQIRTLAHECWHIRQIEDGKLNTVENSWEGKVYPVAKTDQEESKLPWEIDARSNSSDLVLKYVRYMRDVGSSKRVIKIKE